MLARCQIQSCQCESTQAYVAQTLFSCCQNGRFCDKNVCGGLNWKQTLRLDVFELFFSLQ
jgi:hypothetical protein